MQKSELYGFMLNEVEQIVALNQDNTKALKDLFEEKRKMRDTLAEVKKNELCDLLCEHMKRNQKNEEKYIVWDNLDRAIKMMDVFFCEQYKRNVVSFNINAQKSAYMFLVALNQFENMYSEEIQENV